MKGPLRMIANEIEELKFQHTAYKTRLPLFFEACLPNAKVGWNCLVLSHLIEGNIVRFVHICGIDAGIAL